MLSRVLSRVLSKNSEGAAGRCVWIDANIDINLIVLLLGL